VTPDYVRRLYTRLLKRPEVRIVTQQQGMAMATS
jgi:hypothetical protein